MIDHMGISVADIAKSRSFYEAALGPLGMAVQMEATPEQNGDGTTALGFGVPGEKIFWISDGGKAGDGIHVAFRAGQRGQVDNFYRAALEAGGRDNGAPGIRRDYGPNYYAAFVYDPDGANIEVVCYAEE